MQFQLIDPGEVADHIVATLPNGASGRLPDIGGPQVQRVSEIARDWLKATGKRLIKIPVPAAGPLQGLRERLQLLSREQDGQHHMARLARETLSGRSLVAVTLRGAAKFPL